MNILALILALFALSIPPAVPSHAIVDGSGRAFLDEERTALTIDWAWQQPDAAAILKVDLWSCPRADSPLADCIVFSPGDNNQLPLVYDLEALPLGWIYPDIGRYPWLQARPAYTGGYTGEIEAFRVPPLSIVDPVFYGPRVRIPLFLR